MSGEQPDLLPDDRPPAQPVATPADRQHLLTRRQELVDVLAVTLPDDGAAPHPALLAAWQMRRGGIARKREGSWA